MSWKRGVFTGWISIGRWSFLRGLWIGLVGPHPSPRACSGCSGEAFAGVEKRFDISSTCMYARRMATKTISIDLIAYNRLTAARLHPTDSFSQVIRGARWDSEAKSCSNLLTALQTMPTGDEAVLDYLEKAQQEDKSPDNPWA